MRYRRGEVVEGGKKEEGLHSWVGQGMVAVGSQAEDKREHQVAHLLVGMIGNLNWEVAGKKRPVERLRMGEGKGIAVEV